MCMSCLLQVYAWKIAGKHTIIFLGKKPNNENSDHNQNQTSIWIQVITKEMQNMY